MTVREVDAVIVGAGFAGLYGLHRLRGLGLDVQVYERGDDVGGTWYWNRYPGARCDVESLEYSYQFSDSLQQEWRWTERYATQPEILAYANHVADRFDLRRDIQFNSRVRSAVFDESIGRWRVGTDAGETVTTQFLIMATGCLSAPNRPEFPGFDDFAGEVFYTNEWPHDGVDFTGRRVGVIGTGSSAIQSIPIIAEQAAHLTVFQRTPNYSVPAHNQPLAPELEGEIKADYAQFRHMNRTRNAGFGARYPLSEESVLAVTEEERQRRFEKCWQIGGLMFMGAYGDLLQDDAANNVAAKFVRDKIRGIVDDPDTAELLCPDTVMGCKRLCVDTGYYATFNRDNVRLVSVKEYPIERFTRRGLVTGSREYEFDTVVFATGFDAMTGALLRMDIRGRGGRSLQEKWSEGPRTYLGLAINGFPNLFTITGPGSPSVLSNMIQSIEQHVDFISDCIVYMRGRGQSLIEADAAAEDAWVLEVNAVADQTLFPHCNSWYLGANVPGKPRVFMPYLGFPEYVEKCEAIVASGYQGFRLAAG